jgi:hypothetical protein
MLAQIEPTAQFSSHETHAIPLLMGKDLAAAGSQVACGLTRETGDAGFKEIGQKPHTAVCRMGKLTALPASARSASRSTSDKKHLFLFKE